MKPIKNDRDEDCGPTLLDPVNAGIVAAPDSRNDQSYEDRGFILPVSYDCGHFLQRLDPMTLVSA